MSRSETIFQSRADQAANYLRRKLKTGDWQDRLPSERALAEKLAISRRSVREALHQLEGEGFFRERSRQGVWLAPYKERKSAAHSVGVIYHYRTRPSSLVSGKNLQILEIMQRIFEGRNIRMEIHRIAYPHTGGIPENFKKLFRDYPHDCWVLNAPTISMQIWCRQQGIPALVAGIGHESDGLPDVGVNHFALCRHAVGEMARRGHRRLALILPKEERGEDVFSREGFAAGLRDFSNTGVSGHCFSHDQSQSGVCRLADRLLGMTPKPTAWLICRQGHFITLMSHLMHKGIKIPGKISLVSRDSEAFIDDLIPSPTRYEYNPEILARQYAQLAIRIMNGQRSLGKHRYIIPTFIPGETLEPAPSLVQTKAEI